MRACGGQWQRPLLEARQGFCYKDFMVQDSTNSAIDWNRLFWLGLAAVASAAGLFLVAIFHDSFFHLFPEEAHPVFHVFAEFTSIVLSFAIFSVGWYGYKQRPDSRNIVLALTFFAVGLIDFVHAFSFPDMPVFLTENTMDKAATFFVISQLVAAAGLFIMALVSPKPPPRWLPTYALLAASGTLVLVFVLVESYRPQIIPAMMGSDGTPTVFNSVIGVLTIALEAAVLVILQKRPFFARGPSLLLQTAMIVAIFSEMPFVYLNQTYDEYFISHIFNAIAYYFILRAIFFSSLQQPYVELKAAREELEDSFGKVGAALTSSLELDKALSLIVTLASDLLNSRHALVGLKKKGAGSVMVRASRGIKNPPVEIPLKDNLAGLVWETRQPVHIDDISDTTQPYRSVIAAAEGLHSAVAAPVLRDETFLGEIAVYSEEPAAYGDSEARLLAAFARQAAVAIENARLFESELDSKARMEAYTVQLAILHNVSLQLNRETDTNRLLRTVLMGAMQLTGAGVGIMTLIEDNKTEVVSMEYADWFDQRCEIAGNLEKLHQGITRLLAGRGRESLRITKLDEADVILVPPQGHLGLHGLLAGTIRDTRGRVKGHFMLSNKAEGAEFTTQDEEIISLLAAQSSVALISAENFEREHYVAESLQSALLPTVPEREDLELGLLYRTAGPYGRVGGDFYDFVDLEKGRIAVVVGDVCGKGIEAATYTAMVKYMLRAYLGEEMFPGDCLTRLDANIGSELSMEKFITVCLAVIDTVSGTMNYASAGHPPPVVCRPGSARALQVPSAVPLGVLEGQTYLSSQINLEGICQIILYSDGLIEARPEDGDPFGEERVAAAAVDSCHQAAQNVADKLMAAAVAYSGGKLKDDIALLVVRLIQNQC